MAQETFSPYSDSQDFDPAAIIAQLKREAEAKKESVTDQGEEE